MSFRKILLLDAILSLVALNAGAWGQKGHDTVVHIAEKHLTPAASAAVSELLDGRSPVYYANWLDNASNTPEYAYSKTWHYKNIDAGEEYESASLLPEGDIVRAIEEQKLVLADTTASRDDRALALKMIIHFLGDLHQPMHLGHATDRGGNQWKVQFFGKDTNIHTVWDTYLPEAAHKWSYSEWQDQIDRADEAEAASILKGTTSDWAKETFSICSEIYDTTPQGTNISYDYIANWTPVIERQFLKGGLRLADMLNSILDPAYVSPVN